jgi:divalent metal cation (Fe/Co/Zn/Cd) transporter
MTWFIDKGRHGHGYSKEEYFSRRAEGTLILIAALGIGFAAMETPIALRPLEKMGLGLGISLVASMVNLGVPVGLSKAGNRYQSVTLESDTHHLMTVVWTSGGGLIEVAAVGFTEWVRLNLSLSICALYDQYVLWIERLTASSKSAARSMSGRVSIHAFSSS